MVLANKEVDSSVRAELDPLGITVVPITKRDLGRDLPIVVLVTNGLQGKLKFLISLS